MSAEQKRFQKQSPAKGQQRRQRFQEAHGPQVQGLWHPLTWLSVHVTVEVSWTSPVGYLAIDTEYALALG